MIVCVCGVGMCGDWRWTEWMCCGLDVCLELDLFAWRSKWLLVWFLELCLSVPLSLCGCCCGCWCGD